MQSVVSQRQSQIVEEVEVVEVEGQVEPVGSAILQQ